MGAGLNMGVDSSRIHTSTSMHIHTNKQLNQRYCSECTFERFVTKPTHQMLVGVGNVLKFVSLSSHITLIKLISGAENNLRL